MALEACCCGIIAGIIWAIAAEIHSAIKNRHEEKKNIKQFSSGDIELSDEYQEYIDLSAESDETYVINQEYEELDEESERRRSLKIISDYENTRTAAKSLETLPEEEDILYMISHKKLGEKYQIAKDYENAIYHYETILKINPELEKMNRSGDARVPFVVDALKALGDIHYQIGDYELAIQYYKEYKPELYNRGFELDIARAYKAKGDLSMAFKFYRKELNNLMAGYSLSEEESEEARNKLKELVMHEIDDLESK